MNKTIFVQLLTMSVLPISHRIMVSLPSLHCGTEKTSRKVQTNPSCSNIKLYTVLTNLRIVLFNHSYRSDWQKCAQKSQILPAPQFQFCGKNSIYHLLNKKIGKYVKVLLNKNWVKETVNPVLPSQTPTSFP